MLLTLILRAIIIIIIICIITSLQQSLSFNSKSMQMLKCNVCKGEMVYNGDFKRSFKQKW